MMVMTEKHVVMEAAVLVLCIYLSPGLFALCFETCSGFPRLVPVRMQLLLLCLRRHVCVVAVVVGSSAVIQ